MSVEWVIQNSDINTQDSDNVSPSITCDNNGYTYVAYPKHYIIAYPAPAVSAKNIVLCKFDPMGNLVWKKFFTVPSSTTNFEFWYNRARLVVSREYIYMVCCTSGVTQDEHNDLVCYNTEDTIDIVLFKIFTNDGKVAWIKQDGAINHPQNSHWPDIAIDANDDLYLSYHIYKNTIESVNIFGINIIKLTNQGNHVWTRFINNDGSQKYPYICASNNVYVVYLTTGSTDAYQNIKKGSVDIVVECINKTTGIFEWHSQSPIFNTTSLNGGQLDRSDASLFSIVSDDSNNIYVAYTAFGGTLSGHSSTSRGDVIIFKLNKDGHFIWATQTANIQGPSGHYSAYPMIKLDSYNNIIGTYMSGAVMQNDDEPDGLWKIVMFKLDSDGNFKWKMQNQLPQTDRQCLHPQIAIDSSNNFYVTYFTKGLTTDAIRTASYTIGDIVMNDASEIVLFKFSETFTPSVMKKLIISHSQSEENTSKSFEFETPLSTIPNIFPIICNVKNNASVKFSHVSTVSKTGATINVILDGLGHSLGITPMFINDRVYYIIGKVVYYKHIVTNEIDDYIEDNATFNNNVYIVTTSDTQMLLLKSSDNYLFYVPETNKKATIVFGNANISNDDMVNASIINIIDTSQVIVSVKQYYFVFTFSEHSFERLIKQLSLENIMFTKMFFINEKYYLFAVDDSDIKTSNLFMYNTDTKEFNECTLTNPPDLSDILSYTITTDENGNFYLSVLTSVKITIYCANSTEDQTTYVFDDSKTIEIGVSNVENLDVAVKILEERTYVVATFYDSEEEVIKYARTFIGREDDVIVRTVDAVDSTNTPKPKIKYFTEDTCFKILYKKNNFMRLANITVELTNIIILGEPKYDINMLLCY